MLKQLMLSVAVLGLAGCGTVPMFVDLGDNHIIRGTASGRMGSNVSFSATDATGSVNCNGSFPFNTHYVVSGTIMCSDGQSGQYQMNRSDKPSWRGEGVFDNGSKFRIFVNYTTDPDKR